MTSDQPSEPLAGDRGRPLRPVLAAVEAAGVAGTRREAGAERPVGGRGSRTRRALLTAARDQFCEQGYGNTSVAQIAERAGVSLGTFYQYFRDRRDVMTALVNKTVSALVGDPTHVWQVREGRAGLYRVLTSYVQLYSENARFWGVWEEVTHSDQQLAHVRRDYSRLLIETVERELRRGRSSGLVRADLDPAAAAVALTGLVDRYCYVTYYFDPPNPPPDVDASAELLTRMWADAIGLPAGTDPVSDPPPTPREVRGR